MTRHDVRFTVVGLARVRAPWFAAVSGWANSAELPVDFLKCVSAADVRARFGSDRAVAALLADGRGGPFGGRGRPYREWVALADGEPATDLPLAREALAFARSRRDAVS